MKVDYPKVTDLKFKEKDQLLQDLLDHLNLKIMRTRTPDGTTIEVLEKLAKG